MPTPKSPTSMLAVDFFFDLQRGESAPYWLAAAVVDSWEFPADSEVRLLSVSENASFVIVVAGRNEGVLRLNRPGYLDGAGAVRSEAEWVTAIAADTDVPVAVPVKGRDGHYVQLLHDPERDRPLTGLVTRFVPGVILEATEAPLEWFDTIGRLTAGLHEHARHWQPSPAFRRFDWDTRWMIGPDARWGRWEAATRTDGERATLLAAQDAALEVVSSANRSPEAWGLIHADIRPSNVIVDGDSLTIIDFDDCGSGWFLSDFAAAMTWLDHLSDGPDIAQAWLSGYRTVLPQFTRHDARMASALDMIRALTMLGWTTTHREEAVPASVRGHVVDAACTVASSYQRSATWLFD